MAEIKPIDPGSVPSPLSAQPVSAALDKSISVSLPGGMVVDLGAPRQATQLAVGSIMGSEFSPYLLMVCKTLCHIRRIDGAPVAMPTNSASARVLLSRVTDAGMDLLINAYMENFQTIGGGVSPAVSAVLDGAVESGIITAEQATAIAGDRAAPVSPLSAAR